MKLIFLTTVRILCVAVMGCATANAQSRKDVKNTVQYVEDMIQLICPDSISLDQYCYIVPKENIFVVEADGLVINSRKTAPIPAGAYSFGVQHQRVVQVGSQGHTTQSGNVSMTVSQSQSMVVVSNIVHMNVLLEAGKYYTFEYEFIKKGALRLGELTASMVEIIDEETLENEKKHVDYANAYRAWPQTHPGALDGTYKSKDGKSRITFKGNRYHLNTPFFGKPYIYDGTFMYNDETIILCLDSDKPLSQLGKGILYYQLNDDGLEILARNGSALGFEIPPSVKGAYYKRADAEISDEDISASGYGQNSLAVLRDVLPLEGAYTSEDGKWQMTFTEDKYHIITPLYTYDGTFEFDGELLTLKMETRQTKNKEPKPYRDINAISYKLDADVLEITSFGGWASKLPTGIKRKYYKSL